MRRDHQRGRRLLRTRAGLARNLAPLRAGHRPAAFVVTAALARIENLVGRNRHNLRDFLGGVMVMARGCCVWLGCGQWLAGAVRAGSLHRHRCRQWGERPRKQNQQRQTGDEPAHSYCLVIPTLRKPGMLACRKHRAVFEFVQSPGQAKQAASGRTFAKGLTVNGLVSARDRRGTHTLVETRLAASEPRQAPALPKPLFGNQEALCAPPACWRLSGEPRARVTRNFPRGSLLFSRRTRLRR